MAGSEIVKVRTDEDIANVSEMVWEFFDVMRSRYPDMLKTIEDYIIDQDVAGELRNFRSFFNPPKGECFIARRAGDAVGTVMVKPRGDGDAELNRMYVRKAHRGVGIGKALCQAVIDESRRLGHRTLYLDTLYRHVEALPLYEKLGFERYRDPAAFGGDDERVIHMRMTFRPDT